MAPETETGIDLDAIDVPDIEHWQDGPPHEIFKRCARKCPVHFDEINEYPDEAGFWSV